MMTCKDVSTLVSTGEISGRPMTERLGVWFHLLICRHCRAFARQVEMLARAVREAGAAAAKEPSTAFEAAIVDRLKKE